MIGEWICGWLRQTGHQDITKANGQYIRTEKYYQIQTKDYYTEFVDENTIGQFTGLHDKNGKEIYEGDIVIDREDEAIGKIVWNKEESSFYFSILYENGTYEEEKLNDWVEVLKVIGNIHDNPEMLKEV